MSILQVARLGNPVLRRKADDVRPEALLRPDVQILIDDMLASVSDSRALGLSAPQVHHNLRIIVAIAALEDGSQPTPLVVVNPTMTVMDGETTDDWEGCSSIPDVQGRVPRARSVAVVGLDRSGAPLEVPLTGLAARVLQHEFDHLEGVLFVDRMRTFESLVFREYAPSRALL